MSPTTRMAHLVGLLGLASLLAGASAENKITYPDKDGMTFYRGDSVTVQYVTDYTSPELHLFCYEQGSNVIVDKLKQSIQSGTGSKTVAIDLDGVSTCWFNIQTNGNIFGVNSPFWTFQSSRPAEQTTSTTSPSPLPTASTPAPSLAVTITTQISTPAPEPSSDASSAGGSSTAAASSPSPPPLGISTNTEPTNSPLPGFATVTASDANSVGVSAAFTGTPAGPTQQAPATVTPGGSSSNEGNSSNEGSLSIGAKAGIGAGVGVGAILAIAGLIFFILARRKQRARNQGHAAELSVGETTHYGAGGFGPSQQQQLYFPSAAAADKSHGIPAGAGGWAPPPPPETQGQQQSGPYELYTGPQGSELPATERAEGKRW